jgi:hypothetical protein
MAIGSAIPERAVAQDNTDSGGGDISDISRDAAAPESPTTPPPLPPTFRLLGVYREAEKEKQPGNAKRGFGITAIVIGTPALVAGIVTFGAKWSVEKDRDEKYPPEIPDYSLTPEQKQGIADYDEKIRSYRIAGWVLLGSGLGLCITGAFVYSKSDSSTRNVTANPARDGNSRTSASSSFAMGLFSDGQMTALTVRTEW